MSKQSFWCWLKRHRMLVGGYIYAFPFCEQPTLMKPVMVCQCKIADTKVPSLYDQMKARKK